MAQWGGDLVYCIAKLAIDPETGEKCGRELLSGGLYASIKKTIQGSELSALSFTWLMLPADITRDLTEDKHVVHEHS